MKIVVKIILVLLLALSTEVVNAQSIKSTNGNFELVQTKEFILQENLKFYNFSMGVYFNAEKLLLSVNNPPMVISYNFEGEQTKILTKEGAGPGEFLGPGAIAEKDGNLLIWDAMQLKFVEVSSDGEYIGEYIGVKRALGKFSVTNDKLIIYSYGGLVGGLISVYNINGSRLERIKGIDKITDRHSKMTGLRYTNPFAVRNNIVYYGRADEPKIYSYNLRSDKKDSVVINDPSFSISEANFSIRDRSEQAEVDWQNFILTNSRFKNIYALDNYLVAEVQNGNNFDKTRENVFHIFDYQLNKIDEIKLEHKDMLVLGSGAKFGYGSELLFLNDYPDMTNNRGKFIPGTAQNYKRGEHHNKKITIFQLRRIN
ncbi:MAG TPA: hypothetical protein VFM80_10320 [Gracilimonas sp.]|uniref:hypothetical protein n=1 Tax=Gracilimonas sp. TaxID=1974203 RepID=UPI002DB29182|nr:hypothetical protein [Gracilimonas sp.]